MARTCPAIESKVAFLRHRDAYPERPARIEVIETHMSWVFRGDCYVYKLKKPVRYPFLNFRTIRARRTDCERELELNKRLARDVYLGLVPLTLGNNGVLQLDGTGRVVDWLVKMRRLPAQRMLDVAIRDRTVSHGDVQRLARCLTAFYRRARPVHRSARAYQAGFARAINANLLALRKPRYALNAERIERVSLAQRHYLSQNGGTLQQRARDNRIVDAHGDLRPEHICLVREPRIIDCLEFNANLRALDPVDELAYLAMECERLGAPVTGNHLLLQYLEASGDAPPPHLVLFYKTSRACMRANIAISHLDDPAIKDTEKWRSRAVEYLELAERCAGRLTGEAHGIAAPAHLRI